MIAPPTAGARWGERFDLLEAKEGGPGRATFRALDRAFGAEVELWWILPGVHRDEAADALIAGAGKLRSLVHPSVRVVLDAGFAEGTTWAAYGPAAPGVRVREASPLPLPAVAAWARAVAGGLGAAHQVGWFHGRLVPADVVLVDGQVRVGGLAVWMMAEPVSIAAWKPYEPYLAPEVAAGWNDVGPAADVWGLAAAVTALAAGTERAIEDRRLLAARAPLLAEAVHGALVPDAGSRIGLAELVRRIDGALAAAGPDAFAPMPSRSVPMSAVAAMAGAAQRAAGAPPPVAPAALYRTLPDPSPLSPPVVPIAPTEPLPPPPSALAPIAPPRHPPPVPPRHPPSALAPVAPAAAAAHDAFGPMSSALRPIGGASAAPSHVPAAPPYAPPAPPAPLAPSHLAAAPPAPVPPSHLPAALLPLPAPPPSLHGARSPLAPIGRDVEAFSPEMVTGALERARLAAPGATQAVSMRPGGARPPTGQMQAQRPAQPEAVHPRVVLRPLSELASATVEPGDIGFVAPPRDLHPPRRRRRWVPIVGVLFGAAAAATIAIVVATQTGTDEASGGDPPAAGSTAGSGSSAGSAEDVGPGSAPAGPRYALSPVEPARGCTDDTLALGDVCIDPYEAPGKGRVPATGLTARAAADACAMRGLRLCTPEEWRLACAGTDRAVAEAGACNLGASAVIVAGGAFERCMSAIEAHDMAGNVAEWVADGSALGASALDGGEGHCDGPARKAAADASFADVGYRCCGDR